VAEHLGSLRVIIAAIAGNVAIAICKFGAALAAGSAAMYSEAIHSTVDTGGGLCSRDRDAVPTVGCYRA
jgi:divalent metal cation (Fe/Co/Zn/Cd) transporter